MKNIVIGTTALGLLLGLAGCGVSSLNVKFVEPKMAAFKGHGNRVIVGEGSLVGDVLAIEVLKNGKFQIAGHEMPISAPRAKGIEAKEPAASPAAPADPAAEPAAAAPAAAVAPQAPAPEPEPAGGYDYVFAVNTNTQFYTPKSNEYPATYSFSVTAKTGEIVYIKALSGGDLKLELAGTITEVAGLLL